jgi:hypothetical protein
MGDFTFFSYSTTGGFTWWNIVPTLIGGTLSAGAGALTSYLLARRASREVLRRDQDVRDQDRRSATMRGSIKLQIMTNGTETLHRAIDQMVKAADADGRANEALHVKVFPLAGHTVAPVKFDADEISVFLAAKDDDFVNALLLQGERYTTLQVACEQYSTRRVAWTDLMVSYLANSTANGGEMTKEQKGALSLRARELEAQITDIRSMAKENYGDLAKLSVEFGPKAKKYLNHPSFPVLTLKDTKTAESPKSSEATDHRTGPA